MARLVVAAANSPDEWKQRADVVLADGEPLQSQPTIAEWVNRRAAWWWRFMPARWQVRTIQLAPGDYAAPVQIPSEHFQLRGSSRG